MIARRGWVAARCEIAHNKRQFNSIADAAKDVVRRIIASCALDPIDAGGLVNARYLEPMALLTVQLVRIQGWGGHRHSMAPDAKNRVLPDAANRVRKCPGPATLMSGACLFRSWVIYYHPYRWYMDGNVTTSTALALRPPIGETEKLTINLGVVDLGQIDLLVQEGFYSNRTDLIRTAIRNQLAVHADTVKQTVSRRTLSLGLQHFSRADLERAHAAGQLLHIQVVGLARIADDVTPALARATIKSVAVLGAFHASAAVRRALADRIL